MGKNEFEYYVDKGMFLGHFKDYPEHMTQGYSLAELTENLLDVYKEIVEDCEDCEGRAIYTGELHIG